MVDAAVTCYVLLILCSPSKVWDGVTDVSGSGEVGVDVFVEL